MIRSRENPLAVRAGILSALVHGLLLVLLVASFSWHSVVQIRQVAEVELWDSLPAQKVVPPPPPKVVPAEPKLEPKPEPPAPKAEIQVKLKPVAEIKPKPENKQIIPPKPDPELKAREDEKKRQEDIKRLQQMMADEDQQLQRAAQQTDAQQLVNSSGLMNEYMNKIQAKIKRHVNKQLCGNGKPVLVFAISLLPTGEIAGNPRLVKSSGISACDQAVERAILQAQPLPLPEQPELFAQFRDLNLQFRPNEE